ncbi:MAG: AI-2E family transporter [Gammaproteobacteria bacterium]|nr:AI-2E family transporter [Gammaproteobacteria bacterium]
MQDIESAVMLRRLITTVLLAGLLLLGFQVLRPFIVPVIWAGIISFVTWPGYLRMTRWCGGRRTLAALLMTLALTAAVILPVAWLAVLLQSEIVTAFTELQAALTRGVRIPDAWLRLPLLGSWLAELNQRLASDPAALRQALQQLFNTSYGAMGPVLGKVGGNLAKMFITMLSLFFYYRDGDAFARQVRDALEQVLGERVPAYLAAIGSTVKAVLLSLVATAIAQGIIAGIGYTIFGVRAPVFAAAVTAVAALIPFAVPLVWGGIVVWLFASGDIAHAVGLLLWCALLVSWVDNVVRPWVMSSAMGINFLLVTFGVLGGLGAFGLVGLFVGPAILAILLAVWREWVSGRQPPGEAG